MKKWTIGGDVTGQTITRLLLISVANECMSKTQFGGEHNVEAIFVCFKWGWEKFVQKMLN